MRIFNATIDALDRIKAALDEPVSKRGKDEKEQRFFLGSRKFETRVIEEREISSLLFSFITAACNNLGYEFITPQKRERLPGDDNKTILTFGSGLLGARQISDELVKLAELIEKNPALKEQGKQTLAIGRELRKEGLGRAYINFNKGEKESTFSIKLGEISPKMQKALAAEWESSAKARGVAENQLDTRKFALEINKTAFFDMSKPEEVAILKRATEDAVYGKSKENTKSFAAQFEPDKSSAAEIAQHILDTPLGKKLTPGNLQITFKDILKSSVNSHRGFNTEEQLQHYGLMNYIPRAEALLGLLMDMAKGKTEQTNEDRETLKDSLTITACLIKMHNQSAAMLKGITQNPALVLEKRHEVDDETIRAKNTARYFAVKQMAQNMEEKLPPLFKALADKLHITLDEPHIS